MRLLVMGCGGIGGVVTALLAKDGTHDITAFTTNAEIASAIDRDGLVLRSGKNEERIGARVVREIPAEKFDVVLLCTQPPQVEDAARASMSSLADEGAMVCLQNGLCESRVAAIVGDARTVGAVVAWGASMRSPGVYERTALGGFSLGAFATSCPVPLEPIARALEAIGPVEITENLAGKRWSKLALNSAISTLGTIGGDRLGVLLRHRFVRRIGLEIMTECVHVARKCEVRLEKVAGTVDLDWLALTDAERAASGSPSLVAKHALLLAVGFRYRRLRSSMLAAIERGRPPAIDFLNGEICTRGRTHGVATPVNDKARELVWRIARGQTKSGMTALQEITS